MQSEAGSTTKGAGTGNTRYGRRGPEIQGTGGGDRKYKVRGAGTGNTRYGRRGPEIQGTGGVDRKYKVRGAGTGNTRYGRRGPEIQGTGGGDRKYKVREAGKFSLPWLPLPLTHGKKGSRKFSRENHEH